MQRYDRHTSANLLPIGHGGCMRHPLNTYSFSLSISFPSPSWRTITLPLLEIPKTCLFYSLPGTFPVRSLVCAASICQHLTYFGSWLDADPYNAAGNWWVNQNNFFRSVRNLVVDLRRVPANTTVNGIHWQGSSVIPSVIVLGTHILLNQSPRRPL